MILLIYTINLYTNYTINLLLFRKREPDIVLIHNGGSVLIKPFGRGIANRAIGPKK